MRIMQPMLDHGHVELYDVMGDDLRIVNMARQSFGKVSLKIGAEEKGLINFLMRERHGTPFEGPVFTFNVQAPIFVAREWFRHRIGSFNEYSGRYSKMINQYYVPATENIRSQVGKPGAYTFTPLPQESAWIVQQIIRDQCDGAWRAYEKLLDDKVAKEVARMILPVNYYTQWTWVVNLRSLLNFISLRSHPTAMFEIRQYSLAIEEMVKEAVPVSYEAFVKHGRVAP